MPCSRFSAQTLGMWPSSRTLPPPLPPAVRCRGGEGSSLFTVGPGGRGLRAPSFPAPPRKPFASQKRKPRLTDSVLFTAPFFLSLHALFRVLLLPLRRCRCFFLRRGRPRSGVSSGYDLTHISSQRGWPLPLASWPPSGNFLIAFCTVWYVRV